MKIRVSTTNPRSANSGTRISHGSDDWLIDSGVSKHMIGFKESFVRLSEHESPHKVKLGDEAKALHKEITSDLDRYDSSRYVLRFVHD